MQDKGAQQAIHNKPRQAACPTDLVHRAQACQHLCTIQHTAGAGSGFHLRMWISVCIGKASVILLWQCHADHQAAADISLHAGAWVGTLLFSELQIA